MQAIYTARIGHSRPTGHQSPARPGPARLIGQYSIYAVHIYICILPSCHRTAQSRWLMQYSSAVRTLRTSNAMRVAVCMRMWNTCHTGAPYVVENPCYSALNIMYCLMLPSNFTVLSNHKLKCAHVCCTYGRPGNGQYLTHHRRRSAERGKVATYLGPVFIGNRICASLRKSLLATLHIHCVRTMGMRLDGQWSRGGVRQGLYYVVVRTV